MADDRDKVERGSDNVFADLGLPDADTHLVKAGLVAEIADIVRRRHLTQARAGEILGLSQPDVSRLMRGRCRNYSVERLMCLLTALGRDVDIVVRKPRSRRRGRIGVDAA